MGMHLSCTRKTYSNNLHTYTKDSEELQRPASCVPLTLGKTNEPYTLNLKQQNKCIIWSCVTVRSGLSGPPPSTAQRCPEATEGRTLQIWHLTDTNTWDLLAIEPMWLHAGKKSWPLSCTEQKSCNFQSVSFFSDLPAFHLPPCCSSIFSGLVASRGSLFKPD